MCAGEVPTREDGNLSGRGDDAFWRNEEAARFDAQGRKNAILRRELEKFKDLMRSEFFKPELADGDEVEKYQASFKTNREEIAPDAVNHPEHYLQFGVEVIDIIRHVLGPEGFRAYCIGNELKYRLRAGDKGDAAQDLAKAQKYREFREGK